MNLGDYPVYQDLTAVVSELIGRISMPLNVESLSSHAKTGFWQGLPMHSPFAHGTPMKWERTEWHSLNCFVHTTNFCIASQARPQTTCWEGKAIH